MSSLITASGARPVTREELNAIEAPEGTATWFPVRHGLVIDAVTGALSDAGFGVEKASFALAREDGQMFSTLDLTTPLAPGVSLAVGVRNSTDKSLPLGFCAGQRVFVCSNLAFRSELLVNRKHTRNGNERFGEAIRMAVKKLGQFQQVETERVRRFQGLELRGEQADSLILQSYEEGIISSRVLPDVLREWREPAFEDFQPRTLWSLFNAYTSALGERAKTAPQQYAALTMRLSGMLGEVAGFKPEETPVEQAS